ncbi:MAG: hypothetical protein ACYTEW_26695, partial [Planctomycetota bacterium]
AFLEVTTGSGAIWFSQADGGSLDVTSATTFGGGIYIDVDDATLTAQIVTAGGSGDVELTTTTSGDVIVDNITAADDKITIDSVGAIEENPDIATDLTTTELILDAEIGIGTQGAIETDVSSLKAHSVDGDIVIIEKDDVGLHDVWADR